MEKCAEAQATDTHSGGSSSQVVFINIPDSYPPAAPVTCCYTVNAFQPSNKDWVGLFKKGWRKTRDYHTFVWVDPCQDVKEHLSEIRQAVFNDYYLPKNEIHFYQFCYVDGAGQVCGASTPFCFRKSAPENPKSCLDDNFLIVTTQVQLEQKTREKDEMQKELNNRMEENETLRRALEREAQVSASLKRQNEQKNKENAQLVEELAKIKKEKSNLSTLKQQLKEMEHLKIELIKAQKAIADQLAVIEESERLIKIKSKVKTKFLRQNEDLVSDLALLCRKFLGKTRTAPPDGPQLDYSVQRDATVDANARHHPETSGQSEGLYKNMVD